jgi:hypothetical protein
MAEENGSNYYKPRAILITGAAGFIGSHVAIRLVKNYPDYKVSSTCVLLVAIRLCMRLRPPILSRRALLVTGRRAGQDGLLLVAEEPSVAQGMPQLQGGALACRGPRPALRGSRFPSRDPASSLMRSSSRATSSPWTSSASCFSQRRSTPSCTLRPRCGAWEVAPMKPPSSCLLHANRLQHPEPGPAPMERDSRSGEGSSGGRGRTHRSAMHATAAILRLHPLLRRTSTTLSATVSHSP